MRTLYESRHMTDLIRRCFGKLGLHPYGNSLGACVYSIQGEGEELSRHFYVAHFVVSILVQEPERGDDFERAPCIRSDVDENCGRVSGVLNETASAGTITPDLRPGDGLLVEVASASGRA